MLKKLTVCISLVVILLINISFPVSANSPTAKRAVVVHSVGVPRYGETDTYYYVQPKEAIGIANNLAYSSQQTFAQYTLCLFGKTVPQAALL